MNDSRLLFLLPILLFWFACGTETSMERVPAPDATEGNKQTSAQPRLADSTQQFLQDGCVVLRRGNDVISSMFAQFNRTDKTFSHCGIAFREKGRWYVYHSIGGEDNPDEKLRRDPYERFISPEKNLAFGICSFGLDTMQQESLRQVVQDFYARHIPFDMQFDLNSDERLYCAEMVYKSFHRALVTDSFFKTTPNGRFIFVSTDNLFVNNHAQMLCRVTY